MTSQNQLQIFDKLSAAVYGHSTELAYNFFSSILGSNEIKLFIAKIDGHFAGYSILSFVNKIAGFYWDGVLPEYRKRGIETAMIEYRMNYCKNKGFSKIYVQNMTSSINCYKRLGFVQVGECDMYNG